MLYYLSIRQIVLFLLSIISSLLTHTPTFIYHLQHQAYNSFIISKPEGEKMSYFIGIEDLAANALIAVLAENQRRFLSYSEIEEYGSKVIQILTEKGEKATLILSRESTTALYRNYSDYFEEKKQDGKNGIYLKDEKTIDDLIDKFRGYLSLDVLLAFVDKRSVEVLGVSA